MTTYDNIIVIQSYPNALALANRLSTFDGYNCIIVSLDYDLYKFFKKVAPDNFDVILCGNARIVRKSILKYLRKPMVERIIRRSETLATRKLILNYKHWCDIGALYPKFIVHEQLDIWVPYEEERYSFEALPFDEKKGFLARINHVTGGMLKKYAIYDSANLFVSNVIGLNLEHEKIRHAEEVKVRLGTKIAPEIMAAIETPAEHYAVYVEREVLRSKHTTLFKYIKLVWALRKASKNAGLDIYVKFKPRQYYVFKHILHRLLGLKILPNHVPAQIYCFDENCVLITGVTSSSLAIDYQKRFLCLAKIEEIFQNKFAKNIQSLEERTADKEKIIYVNSIAELPTFLAGLDR